MLLYTQTIGDAQQRRLFEDVYTAYRGRMLTLARRKLHSPEDAEDAVHQAFLSLAEHFDRLATLPSTELGPISRWWWSASASISYGSRADCPGCPLTRRSRW